MTADFRRRRDDLTFLRRRIKPGQEPATVPAEPHRNFLDLSNSLFSTKPGLAEKPSLSGPVELTPTAPVVRLSQWQSAVGSLIIAGATHAAWETSDLATGSLTEPGVAPTMPVFANRALVEFHEGRLVVGLRHLAAIRRLVATGPGPLTVTIHDGSTVMVANAAVYVSVVSGRLEIRREPIVAIGRLEDAFTIGDRQ
jgi:hypothetical protein